MWNKQWIALLATVLCNKSAFVCSKQWPSIKQKQSQDTGNLAKTIKLCDHVIERSVNGINRGKECLVEKDDTHTKNYERLTNESHNEREKAREKIEKKNEGKKD